MRTGTRALWSMLVAAAVMVVGCREQGVQPPPGEPQPDSIDCPPPLDDGLHGYRHPRYACIKQVVSHDGRYLAYLNGETSLRVLDLRTMNNRSIDIKAMMPDSIRFIGVGSMLWCPYDNTRLAMSAVTLTDTIGTRKRFDYGQHLITISITDAKIEFITPPIFSSIGPGDIRLFAWLLGSRPGLDTFLLCYRNPDRQGESFPIRRYIPQTRQLLPSPYPATVSEGHFAQRRDGSSFIGVTPSPSSEDKLFIDNYHFHLAASLINNVSWSPNGKKVALSVMPKTGGIHRQFEQIWLIDVEKMLRDRPDTPTVSVINLQTRFCCYSLPGCHAEFITDSSLAVSMHPDGESSPLWEISTNGRKIRQLTFLP